MKMEVVSRADNGFGDNTIVWEPALSSESPEEGVSYTLRVEGFTVKFYDQSATGVWTAAEPLSDERQALGFDVREDGTAMGVYHAEGSGSFEVDDIFLGPSWSANQAYNVEPGPGDFWVLWGAVHGVTRNRLASEEDGGTDYVLFNKIYFDRNVVSLRRVNHADGSLIWETELYADSVPDGFNVHVENDIRVTDGQVKVLTTRREPLCTMLFCVDKFTGEVVAKQIILDGEEVPTDHVHTKKILDVPAGNATIVSDSESIDLAFEKYDFDLPGHGAFDIVQSNNGREDPRRHLRFFLAANPSQISQAGVGNGGGTIIAVPIEAGRAPLVFAQFGDGGGFFSQIRLTNSGARGGSAVLRFFDPQGNPLSFDYEDGRLTLPGSQFEGELEVEIPAFGSLDITSDGEGQVVVGYVLVNSPAPLSGVIVFGGPFGLAGVGSSRIVPIGFSAPIETRSVGAVRTGVAVVNLEDEEETLTLLLCDPSGAVVASAEERLGPRGQIAKFADEFSWDEAVDFTSFTGSMKVLSNVLLAGTVIQTRDNTQFATLPVKPLSLR